VQGKVEDAVQECWIKMEPVLDATSQEVIWAYEPVWAIGKEIPAATEYVVAVTMQLRKLCKQKARAYRIIYGGSAGPWNVSRYEWWGGWFVFGEVCHDFKNLEVIANEVGAR
jgi:triosephosphate isomerase (TIM)